MTGSFQQFILKSINIYYATNMFSTKSYTSSPPSVTHSTINQNTKLLCSMLVALIAILNSVYAQPLNIHQCYLIPFQYFLWNHDSNKVPKKWNPKSFDESVSKLNSYCLIYLCLSMYKGKQINR